ncbi:hypothetical protein ACG7TL_001702 [Trametes sanguinea]
MSGSFDNTSSSTGTNSEFTQGPGGGTHSEGFNQGQGQGGAYDEMQSSQSNDMGGGQGAMGSGVAGGYEGNQQSQQPQQTGTEKKDWLDKGIEAIGKKAGINIVSTTVARFVPVTECMLSVFVIRATRMPIPLVTS